MLAERCVSAGGNQGCFLIYARISYFSSVQPIKRVSVHGAYSSFWHMHDTSVLGARLPKILDSGNHCAKESRHVKYLHSPVMRVVARRKGCVEMRLSHRGPV